MNKEEHSYQKSKLTETVHALILGKSEEVNDLYSLIVSTGYHITLAENTDELEITSALKLPFKLWDKIYGMSGKTSGLNE